MAVTLDLKYNRSLEGQGFCHWARSSFVVTFFYAALPGSLRAGLFY